MELNEEQIKSIEEMAAALMSPREIAILLDVEADQRDLFADMCINHQRSPAYQAYQKGKLQTKLEIRKTVVKLAKAGSPAAEPLADKYMVEQKTMEK